MTEQRWEPSSPGLPALSRVDLDDLLHEVLDRVGPAAGRRGAVERIGVVPTDEESDITEAVRLTVGG